MGKFYNIATFFTFLSVLVLIGAWLISHPEIVFAEDTVVPECTTEYVEPLDIDPLPMSQEFSFPSDDHLRLIGRLYKGILNSKDNKGSFFWYECGKPYTREEGDEIALFWAYNIVKASWEAFDEPFNITKEFTLFVWGFSGTIYNESRFDRCAIGEWARKVGEKKGYIKRNRMTKSRKKSEILSFLNSDLSQRNYKNTGIDLGAAQVLSIYKANRSYQEMLSITPGVYDDAVEMKRRGEMYRTDRPWLYWRGKKTPWYDTKVTRWAKKLGAKPDEI